MGNPRPSDYEASWPKLARSFVAVDADLVRGLDPQLHPPPLDAEDRDVDAVADADTLVGLSAED